MSAAAIYGRKQSKKRIPMLIDMSIPFHPMLIDMSLSKSPISSSIVSSLLLLRERCELELNVEDILRIIELMIYY